MKKFSLFLSFWCLICVLINPFIFWEMLFKNLFHIDRDFIFNPIVRTIASCIFFTAFVVYPIFSFYQIVLKIKKRATQLVFKIAAITSLFWLIDIAFYAFMYYNLSNITK